MKNTILFSVILLTLFFSTGCFGDSRSSSEQHQITDEILYNFFDYRGEIRDYFSAFYYEDYCGDMLYYNSQLMTVFGNIIDRRMISNEIIDVIIELYKKTLSLKVPEEEKEMYILAGLGENGHELYTNILSIMYFRRLETNINNFDQQDQQTARDCVKKLKSLFTEQNWDAVVNYLD